MLFTSCIATSSPEGFPIKSLGRDSTPYLNINTLSPHFQLIFPSDRTTGTQNGRLSNGVARNLFYLSGWGAKDSNPDGRIQSRNPTARQQFFHRSILRFARMLLARGGLIRALGRARLVGAGVINSRR